ncbi:glycoside hydrolase [Endogone sp. FLAS-F59071]|nr:glycoside hydrolase [Endogone sp. FLAS-F59071]|eukprot:RUS22287.1 glycoside hydrolase [Endogone sp. FLAS-F59071]
MQLKLVTIISAFLATAAVASPVEKRAEFVFTSYSQITSAQNYDYSSVTLQGPFTVPANKVIDLTWLNNGTTVNIVGKITFAHGSLNKYHDLLTIGGSDITVDGSYGTLDGSGPHYWDGKGSNSGSPKPKFIRLKGMSGTIKGLTIVRSPIHTFSISDCHGLTLTGVTIDNRGSKYDLGHNTDGFDISSSSSVTITDSKVYNNDDCLAVKSGSKIHFNNNYCDGGHGISIGSIQVGDIVNGVWVSNSTVSNSENGVRIKAYANAKGGRVNNINYKDITLSNITTYGIIIQQDYTNTGATGKPGGGALITDVNLNNIQGTVYGGENVYILCAKCSNFNFNNIAITGGNGSNCTGISPKPQGC